MKTISAKLALMSVGLLFSILTVAFRVEAGGGVHTVNCNQGKTIQDALDKANDADTIEVLGACNENIIIENNRITLKAINGATLTASNPAARTILIRGLNTKILDFASISGGNTVIGVQRGSSAIIQNNTIEGGSEGGILVNQSSYGRIIGNVIQNHLGAFSDGITVRQSASADIFSNTISGNGGRGVNVQDGAVADIDNNTIINNGSDGIQVARTSHVRLSEDPDFGQPNHIHGNGAAGVRCVINSSIRSGAAQDFTGGNTGGDTDTPGCSISGTL